MPKFGLLRLASFLGHLLLCEFLFYRGAFVALHSLLFLAGFGIPAEVKGLRTKAMMDIYLKCRRGV